MSSDPRLALQALSAAFERHLEAAAQSRGEDDAAVRQAYEDITVAFENYEDALDDAYDEVTPLEVFGEYDSDDEDDSLNEISAAQTRRSANGSRYAGLDDDDYDFDN